MKELFIDSINSGKARLLYGKEKIILPVELLPSDAEEGDWLTVSFAKNKAKATQMKFEIADLLDELGDCCN